MKKGVFDYNTTILSSDSEPYLASLYSMAINPNNSLRPDLISINGTYKPRLTFEVKSGIYGRSVIKEYQLAYSVSTWDDYLRLTGETPPIDTNVLPTLNWEQCIPKSNKNTPIFYYLLIGRKPQVKTINLKSKLDSLRLVWGDQIIVPGSLIHHYFAVRRSEKTGDPIEEVLEDLKTAIRRNLTLEDLSERDNDLRRSKQQIEWRDMLSIYERNYNGNTLTDQKPNLNRSTRLYQLHGVYQEPKLDQLKRIEIPGPNGTKIYVLAEPQHSKLFDRQLRKQVAKRRVEIEQITEMRKRTVVLLERRMKRNRPKSLFHDDIPFDTSSLNLTSREVSKINSLACWLLPGEKPHEIIYRESHLHGDGDLANEEEYADFPIAPRVAPF